MARSLTPAGLDKQLQAVSARLESRRITGARRLELLRRQAQLGDARDARVVAARRAASQR